MLLVEVKPVQEGRGCCGGQVALKVHALDAWCYMCKLQRHADE